MPTDAHSKIEQYPAWFRERSSGIRVLFAALAFAAGGLLAAAQSSHAADALRLPIPDQIVHKCPPRELLKDHRIAGKKGECSKPTKAPSARLHKM